MKSILLIGLGRFGRQIAIRLHELHQEVLAVDIREDRVNEALPYVTQAQIGDATNEKFLKSLGVANFDVCIVAIGANFQSSLETTALLSEMHARDIVSRASTELHERLLKRNGATHVVYPEKRLADWTAICYSSEKIMDYFSLSGEIAIFEVAIPKSWEGRSIGKVDIRSAHNINILAFKDPKSGRLDTHFNGASLFPAGTMLVLGEYRDVQKCFHI